MSCEESSPDERMSCDEDEKTEDLRPQLCSDLDSSTELGKTLSSQIELHIPHILDNGQAVGESS